MSDLRFEFEVVKWVDLPHTQHAISKGYVAPKNPDLYVVGDSKGFVHYELLISTYYISDIGEGETKEDVITEGDYIGFWSKSSNPLKDLFKRLICFYNSQNKVLKYRESKNDHSCSIEFLPTNTDDRFIEDHLISFVSDIAKEELKIPEGYKQAKEHINLLEYKYRKFTELFNAVVINDNCKVETLQAMKDYIK